MNSPKTAVITVLTYNVLTPNLASPNYHKLCNPAHLDHAARYQKLLARLEAEFESNSIICLQEVNQDWADQLSVLFSKKNYAWRFRGHGGENNGYRGVLIAFPLKTYNLEDVATKRISDTVYWPSDGRHEKLNGRSYSQDTLKSLKNARDRYNAVVWVKLEDRESGIVFCAATYHMPALGRDHKPMDAQAGLLVRFVQEKSLGLPLILTGDFNSMPESSVYEIITSGNPTSLVASLFHNHKDGRKISFAENSRHSKSKKKKEKNVLRTPESRNSGVGIHTEIVPMRSAYKAFRKEEPLFTIFTRTNNKSKSPFAAVLDYIFITEEFEVIDVLELYSSIDDIEDLSLPNEKEMSDHLMLKATLKLKSFERS